jgi:hypothetical protein
LEVALPKRFISVAEGDIVALRHPEFVQGKKFKLNSLWSNRLRLPTLNFQYFFQRKNFQQQIKWCPDILSHYSFIQVQFYQLTDCLISLQFRQFAI